MRICEYTCHYTDRSDDLIKIKINQIKDKNIDENERIDLSFSKFPLIPKHQVNIAHVQFVLLFLSL